MAKVDLVVASELPALPPAKPRLLFFRKHADLPPFILAQLHQHVMCLSKFFEVRLVSHHSNYSQICEEFQPDLTLVEAGVYGLPPDVTNKLSHPEVPKLGFLNADAYCPSRSIFLREMERWGIETYFTLSASMPEYLPSISDQLFIWPNCIDPAIYRDYEQPKIIPVLTIGSQAMHYPWRNRISRIVAQYYPSLVCPHFGWSDAKKTTRMVYDVEYAKLINSSWIAPTCGTVAREVVRKHFEIPGCNSCLVTERTAALEDAGFVDMQNCVFATEDDVIDKLDHLFANRDVLTTISAAGQHLVHLRHTMSQRDQILQWYTLNKSRKPNQRIVQARPFGPLVLVHSMSKQRNYQSLANSVDRGMLRDGYKQLWLGNYTEAERHFLACLNYHRMPEPYLGLTLSSLRRGRSADALRWVNELVNYGFDIDPVIGPDPVEWSYFILALLCNGRLAEAARYARQFPHLSHEEIDRCRWVIAVLTRTFEFSPRVDAGRRRISIHQLPSLELRQWVDVVCEMLKACRQSEFSERLQAFIHDREGVVSSSGGSLLKRNLIPSISQLSLPIIPGSVKARIERRIPRRMRSYLTKIRARTKPKHAFAPTVRRWAREARASRALLLGASYQSDCTHAFLEGIRNNPSMPTVFCLGSLSCDCQKLKKRFGGNSLDRFGSSFSDLAESASEHFDLVLIDRDPGQEKLAMQAIAGAETVLVRQIDSYWGRTIAEMLLSSGQYMLADDGSTEGERSVVFVKAFVAAIESKQGRSWVSRA